MAVMGRMVHSCFLSHLFPPRAMISMLLVASGEAACESGQASHWTTHGASCFTQPTKDTTQDFFVDVFQDNIVIIQVAWRRDGVPCSGRHRRCRFGPCYRERSRHLQGEIAVVREPVIAVIMRSREQKVILLRPRGYRLSDSRPR